MERQLDLEIHDRLVRYLNGDTSLKAFRDWFDSSTWNMEEAGANPDAFRLAGEVELRLAEFSNGDWTEDELKKQLSPLVRVHTSRK